MSVVVLLVLLTCFLVVYGFFFCVFSSWFLFVLLCYLLHLLICSCYLSRSFCMEKGNI